jgi:hypothetical protein
MQRFGASGEAWVHFAETLGLVEDLLPVVSNPHAVISEGSKMRGLGKTPSLYNREGKVTGIPKWTQVAATPHLIERWQQHDDYGICLQTRKVRAFDHDHQHSAAIADAIDALLGFPLPRRVRGERLLQAFTYNRALTKRVVPVADGIIELLADGQQFIAEGTHPSGERYSWGDELPAAFPVITNEQLEKIWDMLVAVYSTGEPRIAREKRAGSASDLKVHDPMADWLAENWETYDVGKSGELYIQCPFEEEHTADSGPSSTAYFPAGTGGYSQGHFVCLHAHCAGRPDSDFLDATGFNLAQFSDLGAGEEPALPGDAPDALEGVPALVLPTPKGQQPPLVRTPAGQILPLIENLFAMFQHGGMIYRHLAWDIFTDDIKWAPFDESDKPKKWRRFDDADMTAVRIELERRGIKKGLTVEMVRSTIYAAARYNAIDTARAWVNTLQWDGVRRIERFAIDCWGWAESDYSKAVGRYVWTAMAGRALEPGVQADMAPILVGLQGIRKTTAIKAMVPEDDMYAEVKLDAKDDDQSRSLRGKLVGELEELRGLNSRDLESVKAFVSRRREAWVPKYKEFENFFYRRCLLIGSTNESEILADPTGERRWLPGFSAFIDVDRIRETRDQLWAEGAFEFTMEGVAWEDAERLAQIEHPMFKVADAWERAIMQWINTPIGIDENDFPMTKGWVSAGEIMSNALGISVAQQNRTHEARVTRAMKHLGFKPSEVTEEDYTFKVFTR